MSDKTGSTNDLADETQNTPYVEADKFREITGNNIRVISNSKNSTSQLSNCETTSTILSNDSQTLLETSLGSSDAMSSSSTPPETQTDESEKELLLASDSLLSPTIDAPITTTSSPYSNKHMYNSDSIKLSKTTVISNYNNTANISDVMSIVTTNDIKTVSSSGGSTTSSSSPGVVINSNTSDDDIRPADEVNDKLIIAKDVHQETHLDVGMFFLLFFFCD